MQRVVIAAAVCIWSFLTIPAALSLAASPLAQVGALALGVAPVAFLLIRLLTTHDRSRPVPPDPRAQERELLRALEECGEVTAATAALRTSLTVDEAAERLDALAARGHVRMLLHDGALAYALHTPERPPGYDAAHDPVAGMAAERQDGRPGPCDDVSPLREPLSERELEVLALLARGCSNKEIAEMLVVSVGTIKTHTNNLYRKLGARNRADAVGRARCLRLL